MAPGDSRIGYEIRVKVKESEYYLSPILFPVLME